MLENASTLDPQIRDRMVETKVTCPFLGSLVHQNLLAIRGAPDNPLAAIEEVRMLGNEGGGDLGDLLVFSFAGTRVNIARPPNVALGTEGIAVGRSGRTTIEKARVVLDVASDRASAISPEPDARLVALVRLLARQAAREFVEAQSNQHKEDGLPE